MSPAGNLSDGQYPLQTWRNRVGADVRVWKHYLPELHVTIGRDDRGAGLTIAVWTPTLGEFASYQTLYAARWQSPVMSSQEALEVLYRGVAAALAELYGVDVTQ
jgi:hypothetical protein